MYREDSLAAGLGRRRRAQLAVLHRRFPGPFNATQAASALGTAIAPTRRLLAALAAGGWLSRVRPGWYIAVPLEASEPSEWREDPWIVAATLFTPGYIGGWSAAEHWGLTDQIFSVIYVVAGKKVTPSSTVGSGYGLHHPERAQGGTVRHAACLAPTGARRRIRPAPHHLSMFSTCRARREVRCMHPKSSVRTSRVPMPIQHVSCSTATDWAAGPSSSASGTWRSDSSLRTPASSAHVTVGSLAA